jgi:hypothetical protein
VIAEPPLLDGAEKATLALPSPGVTTPMVGAPGGPEGVTETAAEASLVPALLVAVTLQLYVVPFCRPVTVIGLAVPVAARDIAPVAVQVTVYSVMVAEPLFAGGVNATSAVALPAVAVPMAGASGFTGTSAAPLLSMGQATRSRTAGNGASCRTRIVVKAGVENLPTVATAAGGTRRTKCR